MICEISSKFNFWTKIWLLTQCEADGNLLTLFLWAVGLQARFCCMSWLQKTCHQSRIKTDDVFNIRFSRDRWEVCRVFRAPWIPTLWPWSRGYTIFYTKILHLESKVHGVWKSQKKSHSTMRAKRATFTFWVDKS